MQNNILEQTSPGQKAACLVGQSWTISDRMELSQPAFTIPCQLGKHASPLPRNANPGRPAH